MSLNGRKSKINNNILIIGGVGSGKTILHQCNSSYVFADLGGKLLRENGKQLEEQGYVIKVLNLIDKGRSDHYNPFKYIRNDYDVTKMISNIILNTTPKERAGEAPFWEQIEFVYLQATFFYVFYEYPLEKRNIYEVIELLRKDKVGEDDEKSKLYRMMFDLPQNHIARMKYKKVVTDGQIQRVFTNAIYRLEVFENEQIKNILSDDNIDINFTGRNGDKRIKTALFCVVPEFDKTYNFLVGMFFTQIFRELCYQADATGHLPISVSLWMDGFINAAFPKDFLSYLATMRSKEIYCKIIIQDLVQLKALFKTEWEIAVESCDTLVYLGGTDESTHKYISKMLGMNISMREIKTADEVHEMPNEKCIVFIRGEKSIYDFKYKYF